MKQKNDDSEVVTKGFLRSELQKALDVVRTEARGYRDEILTRFDSIIKELEDSRENRTLEVYQTKELRDTTEDHERRIIKLERVQKAT